MSANIQLGPPPYLVQIINQQGIINSAWLNWIRQLYSFVENGSIADLSVLIADVLALQSSVTSINASITTLNNEVTALINAGTPPDNFSYNLIDIGVTVTIPVGQQMAVIDMLEILGTLNIEGELALVS